MPEPGRNRMQVPAPLNTVVRNCAGSVSTQSIQKPFRIANQAEIHMADSPDDTRVRPDMDNRLGWLRCRGELETLSGDIPKPGSDRNHEISLPDRT